MYIYICPCLSYVKVATQPAHRNCYDYDCQVKYSHSFRTAPPAAKPHGVIKAPHWGAWLDCSTHTWTSDGGPTVCAVALLMGRSPQGRAAWWSVPLSYQPTKWAGEIFEELVGWRLGIGQFSLEQAESPFRAAKNRDVKKLEDNIWQGQRFWHHKCSDSVFGFGVCHSVTPTRWSLSWNWIFLREPRAPTVKLACEQFQGRPLRAVIFYCLCALTCIYM